MPGDTVYYWRASQGVHQPQGHWVRPARVIGVEGSNLLVSHRATATRCAKEQVRMASAAEKEMREMMMMRLGAEDPDTLTTTKTTRSDWKAAAHDGEIKTDSTERTAATTNHRTTTETATTAATTTSQDADRAITTCTPTESPQRGSSSQTAQKQRERKTKRARAWCLGNTGA